MDNLQFPFPLGIYWVSSETLLRLSWDYILIFLRVFSVYPETIFWFFSESLPRFLKDSSVISQKFLKNYVTPIHLPTCMMDLCHFCSQNAKKTSSAVNTLRLVIFSVECTQSVYICLQLIPVSIGLFAVVYSYWVNLSFRDETCSREGCPSILANVYSTC